jgi:hypothetical protein
MLALSSRGSVSASELISQQLLARPRQEDGHGSHSSGVEPFSRDVAGVENVQAAGPATGGDYRDSTGFDLFGRDVGRACEFAIGEIVRRHCGWLSNVGARQLGARRIDCAECPR